jgi:hypothetical protein
MAKLSNAEAAKANQFVNADEDISGHALLQVASEVEQERISSTEGTTIGVEVDSDDEILHRSAAIHAVAN